VLSETGRQRGSRRVKEAFVSSYTFMDILDVSLLQRREKKASKDRHYMRKREVAECGILIFRSQSHQSMSICEVQVTRR
jgi:hypothetical protein